VQHPTPPRNVILLKNPKWKPGQPEAGRYINFELDKDVMGAEVRVNAKGYSIYFDKKETRDRNNPTSSQLLELTEERVSHTEYFFNEKFEEVAVWIRYTEWEVLQDKSLLPADFREPQLRH